jgi:hypothetical protein
MWHINHSVSVRVANAAILFLGQLPCLSENINKIATERLNLLKVSFDITWNSLEIPQLTLNILLCVSDSNRFPVLFVSFLQNCFIVR